MLKLILMAMTALLSSPAYCIGFENGNELKQTNLHGEIFVSCIGNPHGGMSHYESCAGYQVEPGMSDYFVGPVGVDADSVTLLAVHADGSQTEKSLNYDLQTGKSEKKVNLALRTLLQKPLLKSGKNPVHFQLLKNNSVVKEGDFIATLILSEDSLTCPLGHYTAFNESDCQNSYSFCSQYFHEVQCH